MRNLAELESLPGAEIVLPGLRDLESGRRTIDAEAVRAAATAIDPGRFRERLGRALG